MEMADQELGILTVTKKCTVCGDKYKVVGNLQSVTKRKKCEKCKALRQSESNKRYIKNHKKEHLAKRKARYYETGK